MNEHPIINDRYVIDEEIAKGGMGVVYKATDKVLNRDVAIKVLEHSKIGTEGEGTLLKEAQIIASLNHPNIVTVHDFGQLAEGPYFVMEYVDGKSLNVDPPEEVSSWVSIAQQVCAGLTHAHQRNIIHRDLKPENIMITADGTVMITDFSLAYSETSRKIIQGVVEGTVFYMAPEQAVGGKIGPKSDMYSLGVILYELVTGQLPFIAGDPVSVISQHINAPVIPPKAHNDRLPYALNELILDLLNKNPEERPDSREVSHRLKSPEMVDSIAFPFKKISVLDRLNRGNIVGRSNEVQEAVVLWQRALRGEAQILMISGDPGIGKTRFLQEIITHIQVGEGVAFIGSSFEETRITYSAFAQIIRGILGRIEQEKLNLPDNLIADLLMIEPGLDVNFPNIQPNPHLEPDKEQQRIFEHVVKFIKLVAKDQPLLIALDDIHWADSGTLALFSHLVRRTRNDQILYVTTYREVELRESRPFHSLLLEMSRSRIGARVKLGRLGKEDTRLMLKHTFHESITEEFLEGIYRETEGNPYFVEEICRALVDSGKLYFDGEEWQRPSMDELEIPQGIQVAVESRLVKLPEFCQDTLRMAAILGREFSYDVLKDTMGVPETVLINSLELAESSKMIQETNGRGGIKFRFVHALVPQSIRVSILSLRKRKFHLSAAKSFEKLQPKNYQELAFHYAESGNDELAKEYYQKAGDDALAQYAYHEAEEFFTCALDLTKDMETKAYLIENTAISQSYLGKAEQASSTFQKSINQYIELKNLDKVAELYTKLSQLIYNTGEIKKSREICLEGLKEVEGLRDGFGYTYLLAETSRTAHFNGLKEECQKYGEQALALAQRHGNTEVQADCLATLGLLEVYSPEERLAKLKQAVDIAVSNQHLVTAIRAYNNLGVQSSILIDNFALADKCCQEALAIAEQINDATIIIFLLTNLLDYSIANGSLIKSRRQLDEINLRVNEYGMQKQNIDSLNVQEGRLLGYEGRIEAGLKLLRTGVKIFRDKGDIYRECLTLWEMVLLEYSNYMFEEMLSHIDYLATNAQNIGYPSFVVLGYKIAALSRIGKTNEAETVLAETEIAGKDIIIAPSWSNLLLTGSAELARSKGEYKLMSDLWQKIVDVLEPIGLNWMLSLSIMKWGDGLAESGTPENIVLAREKYQQALELYKQMPAPGFVMKVKEKLAKL